MCEYDLVVFSILCLHNQKGIAHVVLALFSFYNKNKLSKYEKRIILYTNRNRSSHETTNGQQS